MSVSYRQDLQKKSKKAKHKRVLITFSGRTNSRECSGLNQSGQLIPSGFITTVGVEAKAEECRLHRISLREKLRRSMASVGQKEVGVDNTNINTGEKKTQAGRNNPHVIPVKSAQFLVPAVGFSSGDYLQGKLHSLKLREACWEKHVLLGLDSRSPPT